MVSYGFPCAFLLESSPSNQDTTESSGKTLWLCFGLKVKQEALPPFQIRDRGLWLSSSASSSVLCGRQNTHGMLRQCPRVSP